MSAAASPDRSSAQITDSDSMDDSASWLYRRRRCCHSQRVLTLATQLCSGKQITASAGGGVGGYADSAPAPGLQHQRRPGCTIQQSSDSTSALRRRHKPSAAILTPCARSRWPTTAPLTAAACTTRRAAGERVDVQLDRHRQRGVPVRRRHPHASSLSDGRTVSGRPPQGPDLARLGTQLLGASTVLVAGVGRPSTDIHVSPSNLSQVFAGTLANNGGAVQTVLDHARWPRRGCR